ncbi:MAG: hypothetical protein EA363_06175 [Balneolaceae bacterium]|nr:MAG: hypothetical protein EA363_06175 [Balneolaceae bacterium]
MRMAVERNNVEHNNVEGNNMVQSPDAITDRIRRHEGYLILEAGAGTGKTYNLTERVIHQLVEKGVPLERLLALTFTDFAAAEMRSRIYAAINRNIGTSKHLLTTRQRFSHNYISTFHSFCNRILQYFPDEVTEISVPDAPRAFGRPDHERSVDGALELLTDYDEVLWMMEWRKRFYSKYRDHEALQRQLTRLSVSDFEKFMNELSGVDDKALEELALLSPAEYPGWIGEVSKRWREERDALLRELLDLFASHPEWFASPEKIPRSVEALAAIKNKSGGFAKKAFNRNEIDEEALSEIGEQGDTLFGYHNALVALDGYLSRPDLVRELASYPEQENFDPDHEAYWNMRDLAELGLRWGALMRYQRFEAGYFNYDDMIWLTHRLFTDHPAVAAQMRARFDQILVDEFQDTDRRQWEILEKLAFPEVDVARGGKEPDQDTGNREAKQLLIVGDVKQAIYGFRGGDVAMMRRAGGELTRRSEATGAMPLMSVELPYSFRSNEAVVTFTNALFRGILGPKAQAASYEAYHQPLRRPSAELSGNAEAPGEVRILLADGKALEAELKKQHNGDSHGNLHGDSNRDLSGGLNGGSKGDSDGDSGGGSKGDSSDLVDAEVLASHPIHLEARRIAKFLREIYDGRREGYDVIHQKMKRGDKAVGVLYKRRTHMYALEDALREAGLPFTVAKGKSFYMRREVRDAWLLLSFLLDAFDDVSLTGLLRSPMVSLSDSALLTMRVVMDEDRNKYPNFWSAVSDHASWHGRLRDADRMALESAVPLLRKLREKVPFRRVSELLEEAFFTSGPYIGAFPDDPQVRENLVKLLDVIRNLESTGRGTLFEVTGFLSNRIGEEAGDSEAEQADPAPIQLMTIHGSKGLEFPMVVLPDMYSGDNDSGVQLYLADDDPDSFLWPALAYKPGDIEGDKDSEGSFLFRILKAERRKRQRAETKRLFYVAVTRAETHVLLSLTKPNRRKAGSFADLLEPWVMEQEADGARDVAEIEWLTLEELKELAAGPGEGSAGYGPAGTDPEEIGQAAIEPEEIRIPDRSSALFREADARVSVEVRAASGKKTDRPDIEVYDAQPELPWQDLSPSDAGTLIHRTLEVGLDAGVEDGLDAGVEDGAASTSESEHFRKLKHFWKRELIRMNVADPDGVVAANSGELLHHCRNARKWINTRFGEDASRRFEVVFEVSVPVSRVDGAGTSSGSQNRESPDTEALDAVSPDTGSRSHGNTDRMEKNVTIRGSIDMLIRDSEGQMHIVDFKTGPVPGLAGREPGREGSVESTREDLRNSTGDSPVGPVGNSPDNSRDGTGNTTNNETDVLVRHAKNLGYDKQIRNYLVARDVLHGTSHAMDPARVWLLFTAPEPARAVSLADF